MGFVSGIWLFVLGVLGAASLIIARKPEAKELIGKVSPYQGWIGFVSLWWGAWGIISSILNIGWLSHYPIYWITFLASSAIQLLLGALLGVAVFKTFVKQEQAVAKMDQMLTKIAPYQGTLGLLSIGLGAWMVVAAVLWHI